MTPVELFWILRFYRGDVPPATPGPKVYFRVDRRHAAAFTGSQDAGNPQQPGAPMMQRRRDIRLMPPPPDRLDWFDRVALAFIWTIFATVIGFLMFGMSTGCQHISPAAQKKVAAIHDKGATNDANGKTNPVRHPFAALTVTIKFVGDHLKGFIVIGTLLALAGFGMSYTPLSLASKFMVPIGASVAGGSLAGVIILPFLPWIIGIAAALALALFVYEWYRLKSLKAVKDEAIDQVERLVGQVSPTPPTPPTPAPATVPAAA